MSATYLVIGAGVNGLACASELAKAGKKVVVLEQRTQVGGLSGRRSFGAPADGFSVPGVRHDTQEIRPALVESLGLQKKGVTLLADFEPLFASDEQSGLVLHGAPEAAREEIAKRSAKDADAYAAFRSLMTHMRKVLDPLVDKPPPPVLPRGMGELFDMGLMGLKLRGMGPRDMVEVMRAAPMCVADWMREQFETELVSATLAFHACVGDFVGPWSPGTAAMLMIREALLVPGVKGGPAAVVDALVATLAEQGVEVRTNAKVGALRVQGTRITGVALEGGEEIAADVVVCACSPKHALGELLPPLVLSTADTASVRTIRSRGTAAKVHLGLRAAPTWRGRPGQSFARVRVGGAHLDDLERAFDAVKYRELADKPVLDIAVSESNGKPVLSILVHAAPYTLDAGWSETTRNTLLQSVLNVLESHAPGTRDSVVASEVLSPMDIESEFGIPGGSLHHTERALDQMVLMRPARPFARYATPIEGLYVGSSGCHPGPGVTLAPGVLSARAALARGTSGSIRPPAR